MKNWKRFEADPNNKINLKDSVSAQIVNALGTNLPTEFLKESHGERTKKIMDALSQLGREQGFKSMSHGITISKTERKRGYNKKGFKYGEWLFDLHWYEEQKRRKYQQTSLPLVVECEWNWIREAERKKEQKKKKPKIDKFGAIKWDFQKLLVVNADLRVMIFQWRVKGGKKLNWRLDDYFTKTISGYRNLQSRSLVSSGSQFLFVAFDKDGFWYSEKTKP
jgi:hypothetical protein